MTMILNIFNPSLKGLVIYSVAVVAVLSCSKSPEVKNETEADAKLAVIDATTYGDIPPSIAIDGLAGGASTMEVSKDLITYAAIQAGTRSLHIGNYADTVTLSAGKHHSLLLYAADSMKLVLDTLQTEKPDFSSIRWLLTGDNPNGYQVDFEADSVWKNHMYYQFIPIWEVTQVGVVLRRNDSERTFLARSTYPVESTRNITMKIVVSPDKKTFSFEPMVHLIAP